MEPLAFKGWGGYTDCTHLMRNGCRAISLVACQPDGLIKHWHTLRDTLDQIEPETYRQSMEIVNHLVQKLDANP